MHSSLGSPPLSVLKTPFLVFTVLCLLWFGSGCSQMNALEEQQVMLKQSISINAEMTASLIQKMDDQREEMDSALDAYHREQQSVIDRQNTLEEHVNTVTNRTDDMARQVELISNEFDTFNSHIEQSQQRMAAQYSKLTDTQSTLLATFEDIKINQAEYENQFATLLTHHTTLSERFEEDRANNRTLTQTYQTLNESLNSLQTREDERYHETQATVSQFNATSQTWAADLSPLQETITELTTSIETLRANQSQTEEAILKKNDELLQRIQALKTEHAQWQAELNALQQETENLHSNAASLDQRLSQTLTEVQQE